MMKWLQKGMVNSLFLRFSFSGKVPLSARSALLDGKSMRWDIILLQSHQFCLSTYAKVTFVITAHNHSPQHFVYGCSKPYLSTRPTCHNSICFEILQAHSYGKFWRHHRNCLSSDWLPIQLFCMALYSDIPQWGAFVGVYYGIRRFRVLRNLTPRSHCHKVSNWFGNYVQFHMTSRKNSVWLVEFWYRVIKLCQRRICSDKIKRQSTISWKNGGNTSHIRQLHIT